MTGIFTTAYLPPVTYFQKALQFDEICIECCESWQKQSYRNRCYILGPHGRQMLNIPVVHNESGKVTGRTEISYREDWQRTHWQAIRSAYGSSPFFEILGPELDPFYRQRFDYLIEWNTALLKLLLSWMNVDITLSFTESWQPGYPHDFRETFHPKRENGFKHEPYPQVFTAKENFAPNLSVIDLLFNEGPAAYDYLRN